MQSAVRALRRPAAATAAVAASSRLQAASLPRVVAAPTRRNLSANTTSAPASASTSYEFIQVSRPRPGVAQVTLHRPKALNALCTPLITELNAALGVLNSVADVGAVVLTGSERAFAAGADIKEMAPLSFSAAYTSAFIESWSALTATLKKPLIAAVSGHALGGGCELALMADILYCTSGANFGQPEIKLGTIPGAGGSQRLARAVGKSRAMELVLTGRSFSGDEAALWGVAARAFPTHAELIDAALDTAETIAGYSRVAVMAAKEVVNKSQDLPLRDGVEYERRVFHSLFGSRDQKIGMAAFVDKKKPEWSHE
ncbi:enoyl-CoA hydratase [Lasiosphaeria miniovina]|uniref:Probable enoyl-CoA hydratase, mitochondrial n=1 Tax=Lasiosphaeria miniovina TaxID=1954250 RepID=A0AA40A4I7_9PEZI|nr:enoyl-CoA hydratase [Lasiosphaeria miniovina]KAK0709050.1 enoyl-CoA hydratase [Lasiosphaeria miniovina]